jgi:hypothetical protein
MNEPLDPAETDARDERLAGALAVPPLDDVTRRRLVREALDRPVPRPSRVLAAASVAAALAVGGVIGAVLVTGPQQSDTTTAQRAPTASAEADSGRGAAPESFETLQGGEKAAAAPVTSLGELGDVTRPADLRDAIDLAFERSAGPIAADQIVGYPCAAHPAESFGLAATNALGIGTYDGVAATVMIGTSPAGDALAVVVHTGTCAVLASVTLPKG